MTLNEVVVRAIAKQIGCSESRVRWRADSLTIHPSGGDVPLAHFLNTLKLESNLR